LICDLNAASLRLVATLPGVKHLVTIVDVIFVAARYDNGLGPLL
jgi:hypothetical protein